MENGGTGYLSQVKSYSRDENKNDINQTETPRWWCISRVTIKMHTSPEVMAVFFCFFLRGGGGGGSFYFFLFWKISNRGQCKWVGVHHVNKTKIGVKWLTQCVPRSRYDAIIFFKIKFVIRDLQFLVKHGDPYTGKTTSLYWDSPLVIARYGRWRCTWHRQFIKTCLKQNLISLVVSLFRIIVEYMKCSRPRIMHTIPFCCVSGRSYPYQKSNFTAALATTWLPQHHLAK